MKKAVLLFMFVSLFAFVKAQSNNEEIELVQSVFGMEKKAIIAEFVKVDNAQKDAFWKLYDEYEMKRKELGKKRIELYTQYAENFDKLTNESAEKWTSEVMKLASQTDKLVNTYSKKVAKLTNPVVGLQFYQIEWYILSGIRVSILEELPLPDMK